MKKKILTLLLSLTLFVSSFSLTNATVPGNGNGNGNAYGQGNNSGYVGNGNGNAIITVNGDMRIIRISAGNIWIITVFNGPELVNVIIEAQE